MKKTKILIDTDPGNDDLLAIVMALSSPRFNLRGLTVVGGNASLVNTTNNALSLLSYMGRTDIPVYVGYPSAMNETLTSSVKLDEFKSHRSRIHGDTGLHVDLPEPTMKAMDGHAVDFIISESEANKGELVLLPIGPLTNIARAIEKEPKLIDDLPVVLRVRKFDEAAAKEFSSLVSRAQNTGQPVLPIIIDSYGGQVYSLMSMISDIKYSRIPIATIVQGKAMSCGAILFSFGVDGMRYMDPDATLMIHDVSAGQHGKVEELKATLKVLEE